MVDVKPDSSYCCLVVYQIFVARKDKNENINDLVFVSIGESLSPLKFDSF